MTSVGRARRWVPEVLGVLWVVAAGVAVLVPALRHGASLGPYDLLAGSGLMGHAQSVHNLSLGDQIDEMVPWTSLVWTQVHHGHLPLWNPYSVLGMPLAFNWQSAAFALPTAVAYLAPLRLAYTVEVLATLVIAGTGVYVLCRVLRLGVLSAAFAATVYELSGPFVAWLGWPIESVMAMGGWLLAAVIIIVRGRHRVGGIALLAVATALAIYAGDPDALVVLALAVALFVVVLIVVGATRIGGHRPVLRPVGDLLLASVAGGMLGAPLALPGAQLLAKSARNISAHGQAVPAPLLVHLLLEGFNGGTLSGQVWFGVGFTFFQTSLAYMGVIALVLALLAIVRRRRQPEIVALAVVVVGALAAVFSQQVDSILDLVPHLQAAGWHLALVPMALAVSVLAGAGLDELVRFYRKPAVRRWAGAGFAASGVGLAALWVFGRRHLTPAEAAERAHSFIWPTALVAVGLLVIAGLVLAARGRGGAARRPDVPGRLAAVVLLVCEAAFLVSAGSPILSSSPRYLSPTPGVQALRRAVGSSLVGWGRGSCLGSVGHGLGIPPDVNVAFGVQELAVYDPTLPAAYVHAWEHLTGGQPPGYANGVGYLGWYCPAVTTAAEARLYGVGFVLERSGDPGPAGGVFDRRVGDEVLYRIPGAAPATLAPAPEGQPLPAPEAPASPVPVRHPDPARWVAITDAPTAAVLRLRVSNVPGWRATIDGRPLALQPFAKVMLQARVPPGRHTVELRYSPPLFSAGIVLAACSAVGLLSAGIVVGVRRRSKVDAARSSDDRPNPSAGQPGRPADLSAGARP